MQCVAQAMGPEAKICVRLPFWNIGAGHSTPRDVIFSLWGKFNQIAYLDRDIHQILRFESNRRGKCMSANDSNRLTSFSLIGLGIKSSFSAVPFSCIVVDICPPFMTQRSKYWLIASHRFVSALAHAEL
jgi:hypothetical protein